MTIRRLLMLKSLLDLQRNGNSYFRAIILNDIYWDWLYISVDIKYCKSVGLSEDILEKIRQDFSGGEMLSVIERLESLQRDDPQLFHDRIVRCIIFVSAGRINVVEQAIELARTDYRDLIVWAEYSEDFGMGHSETRYRDLSMLFSS
jgi:hypothetical protein